jgi:hypothetical protein
MEGCTLASQKSDFNIFGVNLITDATAIPLGWLRYARHDAWAEDARDLLTELAAYLPEHAHSIVPYPSHHRQCRAFSTISVCLPVRAHPCHTIRLKP